MKLTDTQLVLLSRASQREDGALALPETLKGGAAKKVIDKLLAAGLADEIRAGGSSLPVWRRDEQEGAIALRITAAGLKAIRADEAEPKPHVSEKPPKPAPPTKRKQSTRPPSKSPARKTEAPAAPPVARKGRSSSKQDKIVEMLRRPQGATIAAIMRATGWQQHSVRGFFAGAVRKKLKLKLVSEKTDGARVYRIKGGRA